MNLFNSQNDNNNNNYVLDLLRLLFDSVFAKLVGAYIFATIVIAVGFYVASTNSTFQYFPSTCADPACQNDPDLCPGQTICEPQPYRYFFTVEIVCVISFAVDYTVRLLTCWAVVPK